MIRLLLPSLLACADVAAPPARSPADLPAASAGSRGEPASPQPPATAAPARPSSGPVVCGLAQPEAGPDDAALRAIAERARLEHPDAFVSVVNTVHRTGDLPDCYLTKREAEGRGWGSGTQLWEAVPGAAIGGDRFGNREGHLPDGGAGYVEADLDYDGGPRNAARLVFDKRTRGDWKIWLTIDHYEHFTQVRP
jgi:ribonuclease T1